MKFIRPLMIFALMLSSIARAQEKVELITCDPYNPEDTLGEVVWNLLNDYDRFGHFNNYGQTTGSTMFAERFTGLFLSNSMLVNDLGGTVDTVTPVSIMKYVELGMKNAYYSYLMVAEKKPFTAKKVADDTAFIGYVKVFKVYSDTARFDKIYELGAIYELEITLNADSLWAHISNISLVNKSVFTNFMLNNYGYQNNSQVLLTNNLSRVVGYKAPEPPKVPVASKSNLFFYGGLLAPNYLQPEAIAHNISLNSNYSGSQSGYFGGLQWQKAYGKKGRYGLIIGAEFEHNSFSFRQENLVLEYFANCDGSVLTDFEGQSYNKRVAEIPLHEESGELQFIRPHLGLFFNFPLNTKINLQLLGTFGTSMVFASNYQASSAVSYTGQKDNFEINDRPELGFYSNRSMEFSGELNALQNFMSYSAGFSFDFNLGKRVALSLGGSYRSSATYALGFKPSDCLYLSPDEPSTFTSQLNALNQSRKYDAFAAQIGFKIYLNEKVRLKQ